MALSQVVFLLVLLLVFIIGWRLYSRIYRNIMLGRAFEITGSEGQRWRNVLLVAFGQRKMFKRPIAALLHLAIYVAFVITQIELIEILIDGVFGVHRFFAPYLGAFYTFVISFIEILSVLAFVATIAFLWRRNVLKLPRFRKKEMTLWPTLDANLILLGEIALIIGILSMNSADILLQGIDPAHYPATGKFAISGWLGPMALSGLGKDLLILIERSGWWLHILTVFGFLLYLPISKHLHILLAFPNVYYSRLQPRGEMENMPAIMSEVQSMMGLTTDSDTAESMDGDLPEFGANDVTGLTWKNILDAYTCTECGRCTSVCPANITGKKLSPRKIMMDIRDRAEEIGRNIDSGAHRFIKTAGAESDDILTASNYDDGKSLFDYIDREEIHACTTCQACVEACPVLIDPLDPILQLRRYEILTESAGPADWLPMFTSLENSGSVWQIPDSRDQWAKSWADETNTE